MIKSIIYIDSILIKDKILGTNKWNENQSKPINDTWNQRSFDIYYLKLDFFGIVALTYFFRTSDIHIGHKYSTNCTVYAFWNFEFIVTFLDHWKCLADQIGTKKLFALTSSCSWWASQTNLFVLICIKNLRLAGWPSRAIYLCKKLFYKREISSMCNQGKVLAKSGDKN